MRRNSDSRTKRQGRAKRQTVGRFEITGDRLSVIFRHTKRSRMTLVIQMTGSQKGDFWGQW